MSADDPEHSDNGHVRNGHDAGINNSGNGNGEPHANDAEALRAAIRRGFAAGDAYADELEARRPSDLRDPGTDYPPLRAGPQAAVDHRVAGADWRWSLPPNERPPGPPITRDDPAYQRALDLIFERGLPSKPQS